MKVKKKGQTSTKFLFLKKIHNLPLVVVLFFSWNVSPRPIGLGSPIDYSLSNQMLVHER